MLYNRVEKIRREKERQRREYLEKICEEFVYSFFNEFDPETIKSEIINREKSDENYYISPFQIRYKLDNNYDGDLVIMNKEILHSFDLMGALDQDVLESLRVYKQYKKRLGKTDFKFEFDERENPYDGNGIYAGTIRFRYFWSWKF